MLGQLIGADNFDIGHIGLGVNGGGIAGLGVVGGASKARGCTGLPQPIGDVYAIDYVAHEMGHQMGGDHTFNGTQVNCAAATATRPTLGRAGLGLLDQAYAGICGSDNLQPHSDPYFSFAQRRPDRGDHGALRPSQLQRAAVGQPSPASTPASRSRSPAPRAARRRT